MIKNEIVRNTVIMTVISLISGVLLGTVYQVTAEPIKQQKIKTQNEAYQSVMKDASEFTEINGFSSDDAQKILNDAGFVKDSVNECVVAKDDDGKILGYVINVEAGGGYGGNISFSMGVDASGKITGISITDISETPGLGMKAKTDPSFLSQFIGNNKTEYTLRSDVNAITSATFTSKAMTNGINAGLAYFRSIGGEQ